jgi:hypothetical protein
MLSLSFFDFVLPELPAPPRSEPRFPVLRFLPALVLGDEICSCDESSSCCRPFPPVAPLPLLMPPRANLTPSRTSPCSSTKRSQCGCTRSRPVTPLPRFCDRMPKGTPPPKYAAKPSTTIHTNDFAASSASDLHPCVMYECATVPKARLVDAVPALALLLSQHTAASGPPLTTHC